MKKTKKSFRISAIAGAIGLLCLATLPHLNEMFAQNRKNFSRVSEDTGSHVALGLALRKLSVSGTFMQAPAHPDDETNALFTLFGYGMGLRTIDVQNNRGDGGQNEIGPELFRDIAVLRTSELVAAHEIDGAEQYFTRAIDYGYSFDPQEVITKWGEKDIVGDYVRLLRTLRPDVVVTMNIQGRGGDRAHEATTILAHEGYLAAGDSSKYPEQLTEGLRPWQPKKLYFAGGAGVIGAPDGGRGGGRGGSGGRGTGGAPAAAPGTPPGTPVAFGTYDNLLCRTYQEIAADAHSSHKCQGTGGLPALPGVVGGRGGGRGGGGYTLMETSLPGQKGKTETGVFEGIDISLTSIAQYAGPNPPAALTSALTGILTNAKKAQAAFAAGDDAGTAAPAEAGLTGVRTLRAALPSMSLSDLARFEIDFRLKTKERDYEDAVIAAHGMSFDAVADDGLVIDGQAVRVTALAQNRGASDVTITDVAIAGFAAPVPCAIGALKKDAAVSCNAEMQVPPDAKSTTPYFSDNYWKHPENQAIQIFDPSVPFGVPFAPTPFRVTFRVKAGSVEVTKNIPIEYRYVKDIYFGDKRMELNVVPAFSVRLTPGLAVVPASAKPIDRDIHVTVTNGVKGTAKATVALDVPPGFKVMPATAEVSFAHEDESLSAAFVVTAPANAKNGTYTLHAKVTSGAVAGQTFTDGYQEIEYPHIQRRQVMKPADVTLKVVDVKTTSGLNVGYVVGVGDQVPPALEQLGAKVSFIGADEMASGNLSKYNVIVTGVRAYERREDLRAYNKRLLDYANAGGTVIVQYNKMEFNQADYGPFPAKVSSNRVSDELVPVKILAPADPVFNFPNKIGEPTWANWTQERGLYFLGEKDPKYIDLVSMTDSFKDNPGEKLGSFVEAKVGKGRWFYLGLGLWRQLPAGTEGAYQLLANLISLGKAPAGAAKPMAAVAR